MKFQRILSALYNTPLYITPAGFETVEAVLKPHLANPERARNAELPARGEGATDFFGNKLPQMEIVDGVAIIPVCGPLIQHATLLDKQCGACSYDDIIGNLRAARNQRVRGIILNFDTPGGEVCGCIECAREIARIQEEGQIPIYAFTDSQMASCGYFLAAGCTAIYATSSANVGSIGCLIGFLDVSKAHEMAGYKAEYIVSGPLKGTGARGTALSEEQRQYLQDRVDHCADSFKGFVLTWRDDVPESAMQGQMFFGDDAEQIGLIDAVVTDLDEVVAMIDEE